MKKLVLIAAALMMFGVSAPANAQVSVGFGFGVDPYYGYGWSPYNRWGPSYAYNTGWWGGGYYGAGYPYTGRYPYTYARYGYYDNDWWGDSYRGCELIRERRMIRNGRVVVRRTCVR